MHRRKIANHLEQEKKLSNSSLKGKSAEKGLSLEVRKLNLINFQKGYENFISTGLWK